MGREISCSNLTTCMVSGKERTFTGAPLARVTLVSPLPFASSVSRYRFCDKSIVVMPLQPLMSRYSIRFALARDEMVVSMVFSLIPSPSINLFSLVPSVSFHTLFNSIFDRRGRILLKLTSCKLNAEYILTGSPIFNVCPTWKEYGSPARRDTPISIGLYTPHPYSIAIPAVIENDHPGSVLFITLNSNAFPLKSPETNLESYREKRRDSHHLRCDRRFPCNIGRLLLPSFVYGPTYLYCAS